MPATKFQALVRQAAIFIAGRRPNYYPCHKKWQRLKWYSSPMQIGERTRLLRCLAPLEPLCQVFFSEDDAETASFRHGRVFPHVSVRTPLQLPDWPGEVQDLMDLQVACDCLLESGSVYADPVQFIIKKIQEDEEPLTMPKLSKLLEEKGNLMTDEQRMKWIAAGMP